MTPLWLTGLAWAALAAGFASAGWIAVDIYGRGYRQHMKVMQAVWQWHTATRKAIRKHAITSVT